MCCLFSPSARSNTLPYSFVIVIVALLCLQLCCALHRGVCCCFCILFESAGASPRRLRRNATAKAGLVRWRLPWAARIKLPWGFSFDNLAPASELPTSYSYGYSYGVARASQLPPIPVAIPMGLPPASKLPAIPMASHMEWWPQPPSYQIFLWLFLWGSPSLPVTRYSYGYSYGVATASQLPVIPMAIPMGSPVLGHLSWATVEHT